MKKKQKKTLYRIVISAVLFLGAVILQKINLPILPTVFYAFSYAIIGYDILFKAANGIINGRVFDENFLMAIATLGAVGLAIFEGSYDFSEAVMVMLLYQIGELFQSLALSKSRKSISELMDIRPDYANIEKDGEICKVEPESVNIGDIIIVKVGEKVPIDGEIVDGSTELDTSSLSGESLPREASVGDEILSGSINLHSQIKIKTTKNFANSTVSKILELTSDASSKKAKEEEFISKFAKIYTPTVCVSALLLAFVVPLINLAFARPSDFAKWIYQALTFLVISCPCALVISIPLAYFAGIGGASKKGILIKGSNIFEAVSKIKTIVFDKTGTLTKGVFMVSGFHHSKIENQLLLEYACLAESASTHPISQSLISAYGKKLDTSRVKSIEEVAGYGVLAKIDDKNLIVGNDKLMKRYNIEYCDCNSVGTIVHIAIDGEYMGHIVVSDVIKPTSKSAILSLKALGTEKTVMLTGDNQKVAMHIAKELGIDEYKCNLLPQDKLSELEILLGNTPDGKASELQADTLQAPDGKASSRKGKLAFVGDGINDAPSLMRADVGIAMGAIGSDSAIEASDVVLMDDNPEKIASAIKVAKKTSLIVRENITFALAVKALCLLLGLLGISNMWLAIFADVGVMIISVLNSIRALK